MNVEKFYIGVDLKYLLTVECEGFDMDEDDFMVELQSGGQCYKCKDSEVVKEGDDWYLVVDSRKLKPGLVQMIFKAFVPDDAFEDGTRTEIIMIDLCRLVLPNNKLIKL